MSSTENPEFTADIFALDPQKLAGKAIKGLRVAFAISGAAALILGIVLLLWPTKTLAVVAVFLGINFLIAGAVRVGWAFSATASPRACVSLTCSWVC